MKKKLSLLLVMTLFMAGCSRSEDKDLYASTDSIEDKDSHISADLIETSARTDFELLLTSAEYENMDWSNASLSLPNGIGEIYDIRVENPDKIYSNNQEFMDYFDNVSNYLFSGSESFKNKDNFRFDSNSGIFNAGLYDNGNFDRIKSGDIKVSCLVFDTGWDLGKENDGKLLECTANGNYIKINRGNCLSKVKRQTSNSGWFPQDSFPVKSSFSVLGSANVKLEDKEMPISDAAANCEKYLNEAPFLTHDKIKISSGRIFQINDSTEGVLFYPTTTYNGIPFDSIHFEGGASDFSDGNEYLFTSSQALMVKSDEVEFCFLNDLNRKITPIEKKAQSIVSLKRAADIVSKNMSSNINIKVVGASLVYCVKQGGDSDTAAVHWKFELFNPNDDWTYVAYVNVQDESFFYFKHV